jgi:hypothetical protein
MAPYPLYSIGSDGHFVGAETLDCSSDAEARTATKETPHTHGAVEVWERSRKTGHLEESGEWSGRAGPMLRAELPASHRPVR